MTRFNALRLHIGRAGPVGESRAPRGGYRPRLPGFN